MSKNYNGKLILNISEEVLRSYTKAEVLILVSDYLDNRQLPVTTTRINYDLLIDFLCYYFTKWRIFYWIAVVMIISYLAILAFVIGMYIPLISSII